jgi:predicted nucleic acid-binding protein
LDTRQSAYTAFFDACVFYPAPLRDLLIQLATTGLFRAKWTNQIHDEWIRNLLANRPDLDKEKLQRTRTLMNESVLDCLVTGYEQLIPCVDLPDPNDRHVLAAAIVSRSDAIVTTNLKHFPMEKLAPFNIEPIHPDEFIFNQFGLNQAKVITAVGKIRSRLRNPELNSEEYLSKLLKLELSKTVKALETFIDVI